MFPHCWVPTTQLSHHTLNQGYSVTLGLGPDYETQIDGRALHPIYLHFFSKHLYIERNSYTLKEKENSYIICFYIFH